MPRKNRAHVVLTDGEASIVVDESVWPIVIATWFGEPTVTLVEKYFEHHAAVLERAGARRGRIVLVTDTFATTRPTPRARKRIVELTEIHGEASRARTIKSLVVIESAMMRGVVTALGWLYPKMSESQNVASLEEALTRSVELLRAEGIEPPAVVPSTYRRPARPA